MAANDELPRGLPLFSAPATGGQGLVTYPAIFGIGWVVTSVYVELIATVAVNPGSVFQPVLMGPAGNQITLDYICMEGPQVFQYQTSSINWEGEMAFAQDTAVLIGLSAGFATFNAIVRASAYPI